jgi:hypothetical protein
VKRDSSDILQLFQEGRIAASRFHFEKSSAVSSPLLGESEGACWGD